jgi:hypothetical protein
MVELALVFPLFVLVLFGIIILGLGVFYQQQVTNAAREAARYASIHSETAQQPTVSWRDPASPVLSYVRFDTPQQSWPYMTAAARRLIFGIDAQAVQVAACWSGYRLIVGGAPTGNFDAPPPNTYPAPLGTVSSGWAQCRIDNADPTTDPTSIGCRVGLAATTNPAGDDTNGDQASNASDRPDRVSANAVTAYACYVWQPPLAGFLLIPPSITLRAVVTEPIERQQ